MKLNTQKGNKNHEISRRVKWKKVQELIIWKSKEWKEIKQEKDVICNDKENIKMNIENNDTIEITTNKVK